MYLNNHTYYSLRYGTFSEEDLLQMAVQNGYESLAITDINNTSVTLNFFRLAKKYNIKPIAGIDFRNGAEPMYVGIAHNNSAYLELNNFLSHHLHHRIPFPETAPDISDVSFIFSFETVLKQEKSIFRPNERIGVDLKDLKKISFNHLIRRPELWVLCLSNTFRNKTDFNIHRLLRAVDNNTLLSKLDPLEQASPNEIMLPKQQLLDRVKDFPFLIQNTQDLIDSCETSFSFNAEHQNKKKFTESKAKDIQLLRHLCLENLPKRYPVVTPEIQQRLEKELKTIEEMDFVSFFLVNWDIISYAQRKNYFYVGRGSGANSIVAYLLRITDVDPIELNLYFERFMNVYRTSPPDFDIDFSWRDREDVTNYIFDRYGKNGEVSLIATYSTYRHSAAMRELGKVFGLPKHEIDILSDGKYDPTQLESYAKLVHQYGRLIHDFPNLRSVHASGILISEKPIHYFSATDLPPKGFPTTHFDMIIAEDAGLYKYDILGQRGLGKIKEATEIIKYNQPEKTLPDIHDTKPMFTDEKVNHMIKKGNCIGCFYVESPAMRMLIRKLEVDNYLLLVAASSIIRPGVAQSGMMREYIMRHKYPEKRKDAHPTLYEIMPETYGVMVYQEDVIKVAHQFADLSLGEADVLRRGMSGKFRSRNEMHLVQQKFFNNCLKKGYPEQLVKDVWRQIESFAGYAFAKGHSASYAVESYQSLFLKCYYPLEYMVAVINNGGGYYTRELYFHEARMNGGILHAPCINKSFSQTVIYKKDIYLGFNLLNNIDENSMELIETERNENGEFTSFQDFVNRVPLGIEQMDILIRINAFRFTQIPKRNLLWQVYSLQPKNKKTQATKELFPPPERNFDMPNLTSNPLEDVFDQIELLGFALSDPFSLTAEKVPDGLLAKDLPFNLNKTVSIYGYLVTAKYTKTHKKEVMHFGTFLDRAGHWIDTVHFPMVAKKYPFQGKGIYKLTGKVTEEFGFYTLQIYKMRKLAFMKDQRFV
ncbi:DNA polymerase III subunit alpha [Weeksellaceae bacterium KMM 9713]|uniref:DNA polymerase III subunit alpha n=1 Tax=Profundicola chukchiensis TaxID=2961959 RepID=A0A9X4RXE0_9FLAO|nr:DNA polymerase III subunit alpha [Profundicola chukchiensis]MDG4946214.1 DNA polymerase III subunit alpha [Profundicola chukchiensis]